MMKFDSPYLFVNDFDEVIKLLVGSKLKFGIFHPNKVKPLRGYIYKTDHSSSGRRVSNRFLMHMVAAAIRAGAAEVEVIG